MSKKRRVVVTGMGIVAPNGVGRADFTRAIFSGKSGLSWFASPKEERPRIPRVVGRVESFDPANFLPSAVIRKTDRFVHLGLVATKLALEDAKIQINSHYLENASIILGSGQGGLIFHEQTIKNYIESNGTKKPSASSVPRITSNAVTAYIAMEYQIKGLNQVISTACSSGVQAIGQAFRSIQFGVSDLILTGGVEAPIGPVMLDMYGSMMVLGNPIGDDPSTASRPFDKTRDGFVLSEGAAILILEDREKALQREAPIYAEIIGFGSNCGAYHMVTPNPNGDDAALAMLAAIKDADIDLKSIDYISAHGTATKQNDLAETNAIKNLFGDKAKTIPISGLKSMIGHSIGAAGAIEVVASCIAICEELLPPTINLNNPDSGCDLDYVANIARKKTIRTVLKNSFGFGSNNATLILRDARYEK